MNNLDIFVDKFIELNINPLEKLWTFCAKNKEKEIEYLKSYLTRGIMNQHLPDRVHYINWINDYYYVSCLSSSPSAINMERKRIEHNQRKADEIRKIHPQTQFFYCFLEFSHLNCREYALDMVHQFEKVKEPNNSEEEYQVQSLANHTKHRAEHYPETID